jgi:hypothetical protein
MGVFSAPMEVTGSGIDVFDDIYASSGAPDLNWNETGANTDNKWWDFLVNGEQLFFRAVNDANNAAGNIMVVDRTGAVIDVVSFPSGKLIVNGATAPTGVRLSSVGKTRIVQTGTQGKRVDLIIDSGGLVLEAYDDLNNAWLAFDWNADTFELKPRPFTYDGFAVNGSGLVLGVMGVTPDSFGAWTALPFNSAAGWGNESATISACRYRKFGDKIELEGSAKRSSPNSAGPIATLPVGCRPVKNVEFFSTNNTGVGNLTVYSSGEIWSSSLGTSNVHMDGKQFSVL